MRGHAAILADGSAGGATRAPSPPRATGGRAGAAGLRDGAVVAVAEHSGRAPLNNTDHGSDNGDRRFTARRALALLAALVATSAPALALGPAYVWPLFLFPLLLGAVFFFELGSLAVTIWLGNLLVLSLSFRGGSSPALVRQLLLGTALFLVAGLLLGRVQRNGHASRVRLAASSLTDRLTGLYNYGTFVDYLHNEATKLDRYGGQITLVMLDLDHFKQFNDRHGHAAGNDLLRRVGAAIRAQVREADMPARYGGEEFAVLIRGDARQGCELAERLRRSLETLSVPVRGGGLAYTTLSAGVASLPGAAADEAQLVEAADAALYESKRRGRDRVTIAADAAAEPATTAELSA